MGPGAPTLALLLTCILAHGTALEDLYWEGEEDLSKEFLEVKGEEDGSTLGSHIRKIREYNPFGFFNNILTGLSSTTTTPAPAAFTQDDDDDGYTEVEEDEVGSGAALTEPELDNKEQTIRVSFVAIEPYLEDYSNRDSEKFQQLSHNLADSVNALYDSFPGTQRASLVRIQSRISDNFSCKVTLDIATTGYYNIDKIISVLRDHIRSNRALGTTSVNDNDFSARLIDSENISELLPQCLNDEVLCDNGQCVAGSAKCNGVNDCRDGSDELDCYEVTSVSTGCGVNQLDCGNGQCIPIELRCNGNYDCTDGVDEENCLGIDVTAESQTDEPIEQVPLTDREKTDEDFYRPDSSPPVATFNVTDPRSRGFDCDKTFFCNDGTELCNNKRCDGVQDCFSGDDENDCPAQTFNQNDCKGDDFSCDFTRCVPKSARCDGRRDCDDGADEADCPPQSCGEDDFICNNNKCIEESRRCDHVIDCAGGEDEQDCDCTTAEFRCESDGSCIERRKVCDGTSHCADGSDEAHCGAATCSFDAFDCGGGICLKNTERCNGIRDCPNGEDEDGCDEDCVDKCSNGKCLAASMICNDEPDCPDGSDELHCSGCDEPTDFRCNDGECINESLQCNGLRDCMDGSDELNCNVTIISSSTDTCREGESKCNDGSCVNEQFVCDGRSDCIDGSDEENCPCPEGQWQCRSGQCIDILYMCNGVVDCGDGSDEGSFCPSTTINPVRQNSVYVFTPTPYYPAILHPVPVTQSPQTTYDNDECELYEWRCENGPCINQSLRCDGHVDCPYDKSDELDCAPKNRFDLQLRTYPSEQTVRHSGDVVFQCRDEGLKRAPVRWVREGGRPLPPGSTDRNGRLEMYKVTSGDSGVYICQATGFLGYPGSELRVSLSVQNAPVTPAPPSTACQRDEATCGNGHCIPKTAVCNGVRDCSDNSDEDSCNQNGRCEPNQYECANRRCVLKTWLCDSEDDCGDGSDEYNCGSTAPDQPCAPVEYQCKSGNQCVPKSFHCDGMNDCIDGSDEIGCIPVYISQPPQPSKITLNPGETLTLTCRAIGVPIPVIVWRLNWGHVPEKCQSSSVNGFGTLTCPNMQVEDRGAYSCEAINNKGTDFAIPDAIVNVITQNVDVCPLGYFNSEATTESECIRCFCFGESRECKSADLFIYHMPSPLGSGGTRLVGATMNPDGVAIESNQIADEYYYQPLRNGATVTKVNLYNTEGRAIPYLALPESYNGNQLTSYGGRIKYKLEPHAAGRQYSNLDMVTPDIVIKGQYGTLMYSFRKDRAPPPEIYVEARLVPETWNKPSSRGPIPASREDIMMALDNIEVILIRASFNSGGVKITDFAMESAQHINTGLGAANLVEECKCPAGYEGLSCQKCAASYVRESSGPWLGHCRREDIPCPAGTYGAPARGIPCQPCPCPLTNRENQFARTCSMEPDGSVTCDCMPGYEGRNCEKCAPGYTGNPLMPGDICKERPRHQCDPIGTRNVRLPDQCECKNHVQGRYCDQCKEGSFFLSPDFVHGCAQCFCSGVTQQCTSSNLRRTKITADFGSSQDYSQIKLYSSTLAEPSGQSRYSVPQEIPVDPYNAYRSLSQLQPSTISYWGLPPSFTGDKVTSYGGNLQYTIRSTPWPDAPLKRTSAPDVQLISKNRYTFHFFAEDRNASFDGTTTVTVPFLEGKWLRPDGTEVQRQYLLLALADVQSLLVKTSYWEYASESYLLSASIDTAEPGGGGPEARHVEQCSCPQGYLGTSCEDCAPGYTRGGDGFYLQHCEPCQCNGHSGNCHPETGECLGCADNTIGPRCELCKPGYEKDFSGQCTQSSSVLDCNCNRNGMEHCDNGICVCKRNVEGVYCDRCRQGSFGLDGANQDGCTPCYCSGLGVECQEASYYHLLPMPATVLGSDYGGYTITDLRGSRIINDQFVPVTNESELQYVFPFEPHEELYWALPKFSGNKILSYGGNLALTQRFESNGYVEYSTAGNDVILDGGSAVIYWTNPQQMRSGTPLSYKVPLREDNWRQLDNGEPVDRNLFMSVLADLKRILVRATSTESVHSVAIADVSMDLATDKYDSGVPAKAIELCQCPTGYSGTSCETCVSGYYKDQRGLCAVCPCNRNDCQLDVSGQVVCNCRPPYTGRDCSTIEPEGSTITPYLPGPGQEPTVHVIITGPTIKIQDIGGTVNFTCQAQSRNSRPLVVTWTKADGLLPIDRAYTDSRTGTLVITNLQKTDSGIYICQANDGVSTGEARTTLQVPGNPMTPPEATITPVYKDYYEGERIQLECRATGNPTPTIAWQRAGKPRTLSLSSKQYDTFFVIDSARVEDSGEYSCVVSNTAGSAVSTAVVNVRQLPNQPYRETLSISPVSPKVTEGQNTSVVCTGTANIPPGSIGWSRQDGGGLQSNIRADNGLLYIDIARLENQGVYICQTSAPEVSPVSVLITVAAREPPSINERPEVTVKERQVNVPTGGNVFVECEASGIPTPRVKWTKHGGEFGPNVSQRGNTLIITNAEQSDEAYYMCEGTNPLDGTRVGNVYVMVTIEKREKPRVSIWPAGEQAAHLFTEFEFVCQVTGGVPDPIVTWSRAGSRPLSPHTDIVSGNRLKFSNISVNDEGQYICSASNIAGEATATAELKVWQRPQITLKPSNYIEINRGEPVNIECRATGYPEPTVSIRRDTPDFSVIVAPSTGIASLRIYSSNERDDGLYSCTATSAAGTSEEHFTIVVESGVNPFVTDVSNGVSEEYPGPTSESNQPGPRELIAIDGETTRITCLNTGDYYDVRWGRTYGRPLQRNAEQVGNELIIRGTSNFDAGDYECVVVDPNTGTAREAYVTRLSIVRLPHITVNPATQTVRPGQSPTVDCSVEGDDIVQVKWQPTNKPFSQRVEVLNSKLIFHQIEVEDAGQYVCFVESRLGNASRTAEVIVTGTREPASVSIEQPGRPFYVGDNVQVLCRSRSRDYRVQWERMDRRQHVDSTTYGDGAILEISNVQEADAGVYRCTGIDPYRKVYSEDFTLEVIPQMDWTTTPYYSDYPENNSPEYWTTTITPPVDSGFSQSPSADNAVYTARLHDSVVLNCPHNLEEPVSYEWRREYIPLSAELRTNEPTLRLNRVTEKDAGIYICRVSNSRVAVGVRAVLRVIRIVPRFEGYSWLALPPLKDTYRKIEVGVTFKPMSEDGIILYNSENEGREGDYMALQLVNGIPEFIIEYGGGPVTIRGNRPLQLNTWHTIRLSRIDTSVTMDVDNTGPITNNTHNGSGLLFELNQPMYIGGVPEYGQLPFRATGFIGCVSMLVVGREEKNIMEEAQDQENVGECDSCAPNPCLNNGVCQEARNPVGYMCFCPTGFAGLDCGRTDEACRPGLCGPGRCQDTFEGYKCICPITFVGKRCETHQNIEYPAFSGSAYLAIGTPRTSRVFKMSMKVKAASPVTDGIIMYCAESARDLGKFTSLAVKDGRLEFRYDLGDPSGPVILRSIRPITAEEWTEVKVSRLADTVSMTVDTSDSTSAKLPSPNTELLWETPMFVGGYDDSIVLNRNTGVTGGFSGCIKDVTLFGKSVDIVNTSIQSANVEECKHDRGDIPDEANVSQFETICSKCRNGGYCMSAESTFCNCPPGYSGMFCETRVTFTPMRPPNAGDPCAARPCRNEGVCKPDAYNRNYTCDCPLYYAGVNCQMRLDLRESVGFNGNGYLELPANLLRHERSTEEPVVIAILVYTVNDGVLVYQREISSPIGSGDFLLIKIQNGYVTMEWDMGSGVATLTIDKVLVTDGQIHRIIAEFRGAQAMLTVDSYSEYSNTVGLSNILNADSNVYLGGIPEELNVNRLPGLIGCIQQFEVNDMDRGIELGTVAVAGRNTQRCRDQPPFPQGG